MQGDQDSLLAALARPLRRQRLGGDDDVGEKEVLGVKRGWGWSYLPLFLRALSLSLSPALTFALSLSSVPLPPPRGLGGSFSRRCRTHERALPCLRLCRSRSVSLSRHLCRVPSPVSFLAVVGRTNARFRARVLQLLAPFLCRVTSRARRGVCSRERHALPARPPRLWPGKGGGSGGVRSDGRHLCRR